MSDSFSYQPVFSEDAADFILGLPKRRQRKVALLARQLAENPHLRSDYFIEDELGRHIEHLLVQDYVFAYWLDDLVREVRITSIEDAS